MAGTSIFLLIMLIYSLLPIPIALSVMDRDDHLSFICLQTTKIFNNNFNQSRAKVLDRLALNAPSSIIKGYFYTRQQVQGGVWAYGLAQCRGDIEPLECAKCLVQAGFDLRKTQCPRSESAITWRLHCMLKYSDVDFGGILDTATRSGITRSVKGKLWNKTAVQILMFNLYVDASTRDSYHSGVSAVPWKGAGKLYGMAQCNGDLSRNDCITCIGNATNFLFHNYKTFSGAIAAYASCTARFDTADFTRS